MIEWFKKLGCKQRGQLLVLDEWDHDFYLIFDCSDDPETPEAKGTCDILVSTPGTSPKESNSRIRLVANARRSHVLRFMFAMGVDRFSEQTKKFLYEQNGAIRTND